MGLPSRLGISNVSHLSQSCLQNPWIFNTDPSDLGLFDLQDEYQSWLSELSNCLAALEDARQAHDGCMDFGGALGDSAKVGPFQEEVDDAKNIISELGEEMLKREDERPPPVEESEFVPTGVRVEKVVRHSEE